MGKRPQCHQNVRIFYARCCPEYYWRLEVPFVVLSMGSIRENRKDSSMDSMGRYIEEILSKIACASNPRGKQGNKNGSSGESVGKYEAITRFINRSKQCNILF